jgi:hypothetical protein
MSGSKFADMSAIALRDGVPTTVKDGLSMAGVPIYRRFLANGSNDELATVAAVIAPVIKHRYCRVGA